MDIKMLIFVIICLLLANCFESRDIMLTKEEDLALEKQLRTINKAGVATITTEHGDIYDCVDFYKQPAFDHALLKNHTFYPQMKPPKWTNNVSSTSENAFKAFKDGGCPSGSVPIRRITKRDLIREKEYSSRFVEWNDQPDVAVVQTQPGYGPFNGASVAFGIYKPAVETAPDYSAVRIRIQNGDDFIQVGWRVDPSLYGDYNSRLYTYFKAGNTQCFNTRCSGFVHYHKDYAIDQVLPNYYKRGQKLITELKIRLIQAQGGNWWLQIPGEDIGYWPASMFSGLKGLATYVDWGGEVLNTGKEEKDTEMGLGFVPNCDALETAYCRVISVLTPDGKTSDAERTQSYVRNYFNNRYSVLNIDNYKDQDDFRHTVFYGGPQF